MKTCRTCKIQKMLECFGFDCNKKDGKKSQCKTCRSNEEKPKHLKNPERHNEASRRYRLKNPNSDRSYYLANKDSILNACKEYYAKNKEQIRSRFKEYYKDYSKNNRGKCNSRLAKYRASKLQATPIWSDLVKIKEIYMKCPKGYEVDHIIPLRGKHVCGLHVPSNLQYLLKSENRAKGNK